MDEADDFDLSEDADFSDVAPPRDNDPNAPIKVVVDDLHIVYRVWTAPDAPLDPNASRWRRMRSRRPVSTKREVHALRGVSFVARQGEAVGVIGKNGFGMLVFFSARCWSGFCSLSEGCAQHGVLTVKSSQVKYSRISC